MSVNASNPVQATGADPDLEQLRLIIGASSLGTIFEWYDFFIYGTLAASGTIGRNFFPAGNEVLQTLLAWGGFAVGFGFRPLGAILFGYLGDRLGRKYTFLVTIIIMGLATAGIGLLPSIASIGLVAPLLIMTLRILQGLALGGEYGGAAIYVAEHSPPGKAGFYTSFIQASVCGGFILSIMVVLGTKLLLSGVAWNEWGWRIPFIFSLLLLAGSVWMRLRVAESPVFLRMKQTGDLAGNPFTESFTHPGNRRRLLVALFGIAAGLTVIWYTFTFSVLSFLQTAMRVEETAAQLMVGFGVLTGLGWFILFGKLSDRIGRKPPIVAGYLLTLVLLLPIFWVMGSVANPGLAALSARKPVVVAGPHCAYDPFARTQIDRCGKLLDYLSRKGVAYTKIEAPTTALTIGQYAIADTSPINLDRVLIAQGYNLRPTVPSAAGIVIIVLAIVVLGALAGLTYGPVAALLTELFPPRIRYSSISIPYHIGTGYFGGFLPFISQYINTKAGNSYAGLGYPLAVVLMALVVTWFWLDEPTAESGRLPRARTRR